MTVTPVTPPNHGGLESLFNRWGASPSPSPNTAGASPVSPLYAARVTVPNINPSTYANRDNRDAALASFRIFTVRLAAVWPLALCAATVGMAALWLLRKRINHSTPTVPEALATVGEPVQPDPDPTPHEVRRIMSFMGRQSAKKKLAREALLSEEEVV